MKYRGMTLEEKRNVYEALGSLVEMIEYFKTEDNRATERATNGCGWDRFESAVSEAEFAFNELVELGHNIFIGLNG